MGLWPKIENTNMQGERGRENNGGKEIDISNSVELTKRCRCALGYFASECIGHGTV